MPEDIVSGSAHCALASYWDEQLHQRHGVPRGSSMKARQGSALKRCGEISVRLEEAQSNASLGNDEPKDRVWLGGRCQTVMVSELHLSTS